MRYKSKNGKYSFDVLNQASDRPIVLISCSLDEFFDEKIKKQIISDCDLNDKNFKIGFQFKYE